jgi:hypothetical protein
MIKGWNSMNAEILNEPAVCIICEQAQAEGIHICGHFICDTCEAEMVRTDVMDEKYPFFINQMKRVWYKQDA